MIVTDLVVPIPQHHADSFIPSDCAKECQSRHLHLLFKRGLRKRSDAPDLVPLDQSSVQTDPLAGKPNRVFTLFHLHLPSRLPNISGVMIGQMLEKRAAQIDYIMFF